MIIYYAALQAIPGELEEAAVMDGASALKHAIYVKLPLILPTILVTIVFSIIGTLQLFAEPYLMINLARNVINSAFTPNLYAYTLAFTGQQYNYSAAISFLLGGVTAVLAYAFMLLTSRRKPPVTIVGKTRDSASFRRNRWLLTAVLLLYFVYTFIPILYLITAATKTNPDLFNTFGLWFSEDFHLLPEPPRPLHQERRRLRALALEQLLLRHRLGARLGAGRDARRLRLRQVRLPSASASSTRWCSAR